MLCALFGVWCTITAPVETLKYTGPTGATVVCVESTGNGEYKAMWKPRSDGNCYAEDNPLKGH